MGLMIQSRKMAHLHDLPLDLLDLIIVLLAISTDGARDLTRFAATCKQIKIMAERLHIQSIVNLHQLTFTDDYTKHHHPHDLLCECAAAGNREAMSILAMIIINTGTILGRVKTGYFVWRLLVQAYVRGSQ
uniref:uncharacterized protein LOC122583009 isoform X3 n=1 Tax=Erigeron canadensis TaxID=72917 RepID=UPI001CB89ABE|nr:uncharacterized protein LOC122583009 isoform X3 [Erigeron canadensis]